MQTEFEFDLPKGYVDTNGEIHTHGRMRLATAGDEMQAQRDPRVLSNPAYLTIVLLSEVITGIDGVNIIAPATIEKLSRLIWHSCRICIRRTTISSLPRCTLYVRTAERSMTSP